MKTSPPIPHQTAIPIKGDVYDQMRTTIRVIGKAIQDGALYLPIRNRAAALASKAGPKNYAGQVRNIFNDFVKRWRYVKDPVGKELVTTSPAQIFHLVMGGRSEDPGAGFGLGVGDCDDATVAIGAQLASIGIPIRIATIAPEGAPPGKLMTHVFCQADVPGMGWVTVDPVVHPSNTVFYTPPHSRMAVFSLDGKYKGGTGNISNMSGISDGKGTTMRINEFSDLAGIDDYAREPLDFRQYGIKDFGLYADSMGMMDLGDCSLGLAAEVNTDARGNAWTPILELRPHDYDYVRKAGRPYHGMLALSDDLEPYSYDSGLGFFKKIFKRVKKRARKIAKKLLSKIPGGKYLMKLGKKVWKISRKLVRPLAKFVGKYASKLAPVAALIPGYGPAIAAGLHASGKIARLMTKVGGKIVKKKGDAVAKLKFPSGKSAKVFQSRLKKLAKEEKRAGKSMKRKPRRIPRSRSRRTVSRRPGVSRRMIRRRAA